MIVIGLDTLLPFSEATYHIVKNLSVISPYLTHGELLPYFFGVMLSNPKTTYHDVNNQSVMIPYLKSVRHIVTIIYLFLALQA